MVYQINSIYEVLKLEQYFRKKKVVTGTTPFFVIGSLCTSHLSWQWLLTEQFCIEMLFCQSWYFQQKMFLQFFEKGLRFSEDLF